MRLRVLMIAAFAGFGLSACQTPPEPPPPVAEPEPSEPEIAEIPPPPDPDTPILNEWGGEIPRSQPTEPVSEGGLEDLP